MSKVIFDIETVGRDFDSLDAESQEYLLKFARNNEEVEIALKESRQRIYSMSLVHERLYRSRDFSRIDFKDYIESLSNHMISTYITDQKIMKQLCSDTPTLPYSKVHSIVRKLVAQDIQGS